DELAAQRLAEVEELAKALVLEVDLGEAIELLLQLAEARAQDDVLVARVKQRRDALPAPRERAADGSRALLERCHHLEKESPQAVAPRGRAARADGQTGRHHQAQGRAQQNAIAAEEIEQLHHAARTAPARRRGADPAARLSLVDGDVLQERDL